MREIQFAVPDFPPAKSEAKSMLAVGHGHAPRVMALLRAAREAVGDAAQPLFPTEPLGLELIVESLDQPLSDATNYLGGVADVLEAKGRRGALPHLAELESIALYNDDHQLQIVQYRWYRGSAAGYTVRAWVR